MKQVDDLSAVIHQWILQTFPLARERDLGLDDSLLESGIVDSLGTLEIVQFLESEFEIHVDDEEMVAEHFESINSIAQFVNSKT